MSDSDSFLTARRMTTGGRDHRRRVVLEPRCGRPSQSARTLGPDDVVVVLVPDSGRGYLSKLYDDRMDGRSRVRAVPRWDCVEAVLGSQG